MNEPDRVTLAPAAELESDFLRFFQTGVYLKGKTGISTKKFLIEEARMDPRYLEKRVQTVFLDGKAVDDLDSTIVREGSIVTLSAAMPGLLGATLRVGGRYAPMRSQISHHGDAVAGKPGEGLVLIKLFNLLISELGPGLLKNGVWIQGRSLGQFFERRGKKFWTRCERITLDGRRVESEALLNVNWPAGPVLLRLEDR